MPNAANASVLLLCLATGVETARPREAAPPSPRGAVDIQMRNVHLRMERGISLQVRTLRGRLEPTSSERPVTLDLRDSFFLDVDWGTVAISTRSLTRLLNDYVFAYDGAPLKNITVSAKGDRLVQKGTIHKGVDLPFEMEGAVSATADGNIRLHVEKIKAEHIPVKGLLHLFGEDLSKLINLNEARGVRVQGDDILMFPDRMLPAPHIKGRIADVHVEGENIVQIFGGGRKTPLMPLPARAANYIYHRGGTLRFGKLTMADADLEIVDETPATPFDFSLADYNRQLVAGYSKNTPSHGLVVRMPDFGTLGRGAKGR
jgi:hypothetical protein